MFFMLLVIGEIIQKNIKNIIYTANMGGFDRLKLLKWLSLFLVIREPKYKIALRCHFSHFFGVFGLAIFRCGYTCPFTLKIGLETDKRSIPDTTSRKVMYLIINDWNWFSRMWWDHRHKKKLFSSFWKEKLLENQFQSLMMRYTTFLDVVSGIDLSSVSKPIFRVNGQV